MRFNSIIRAGARATVKSKNPNRSPVKTPKPTQTTTNTSTSLPIFELDQTEGINSNEELNDFTGRVHSESYSAENLKAAFDSLLNENSSNSNQSKSTTNFTSTSSDKETNETKKFVSAQDEFLNIIQTSTLSTIESYKNSILNSLKLDDQHGRIYSKNVRQMKEILSFEKWRKKLNSINSITKPSTSSKEDQKVKKLKKSERHPITRVLLPSGSLSVRKSLFERPSLVDQSLTFKVLKDLWKLDKLVDATVVIAYAGHPTLIDELLKLKNIRKVIAIEELPEYCLMYNERWSEEIKSKRFFQIKNDGYWWESYSELEEEGLLDDVEIVPWNTLLFQIEIGYFNMVD
ncbi:hypothetical protein DFH28DRAFT_209394 [Melampsora americana]|nr:hypothetical protein DFH28DRAFT_209394 [Melampsora americana]